MKVLIVDDDKSVSEEVASCVRAAGFAVDIAANGESGLALAHINEYDLVILDLNLPDMEGATLCKRIRENGRTSPILMLSVVSDPASKARLLNAGADDYLGKPFSCDELIARVRALLRRGGQMVPDLIEASGITLDSIQRSVKRGRKALNLTPKEFALLEYLMRNNGRVVRKTTLIEHAWDSRADIFSDAIETHMANLRRKLGRPEVIHTVHGTGYRIDT